MKLTVLVGFALGVSSLVLAQVAARFEVASVKASIERVGPDYNNQFAFLPAGITARNVTLQRLLAEAFQLQLNQVLGPSWMDRNEYDLEAQAPDPASQDQLRLMLRSLLLERFQLKLHEEKRPMRVYELVVAKGGPKIQPEKDGAARSGTGFVFHGDMRKLADLIAFQLTRPALSSDPTKRVLAGGPQTPVLDKTGLSGLYNVSVNIRPEPGSDGFTSWQRFLQEQLGLKLESTKSNVPVLVVDGAATVPTEN